MSEAECCDGGLQLIAFDYATDFSVGAWLEEMGIDGFSDNEIIVGSYCDKNTAVVVATHDEKLVSQELPQEICRKHIMLSETF